MLKMQSRKLCLGVFFTLLVSVGPVAAETFTATAVAGHPATTLWVKTLVETFIPTVNRELAGTGHEIKWREFYGGALVKVGGELDALQGRVADVAVMPTVFKPEDMPLQNVSYMTPFSSEDPALVLKTINRLHETVPGMIKAWENHDIEYLGAGFVMEDYQLLSKFPVATFADLKGHKVGTAGQAVAWLEGTGATGIEGNLTTYYTNIQTGVIEAAIVPSSAAASTKLFEVAPHVTQVGLGAQYAGSPVVSKAWFDDLPPEVQAALRKGAAAYNEAYLAEQKKRVEAAFDAMAKGGSKITSLPEEERRKWAMALPPLAMKWATALDKKGEPGTEVLKAYMQALRDAGAKPLRDWDKE